MHAAWKVQGVNDEISNNIQLHIASLQFPEQRFEFAQYQKDLNKAIQNALHAYAYYSAQVRLENLNQAAFNNNEALIRIELGPQTSVNEVLIEYDEHNTKKAEFPAALAQSLQALRDLQGKALSFERYETIKGNIQSLALIYGYFDFKLSAHELRISSASNTAQIFWQLEFGSRYTFGELVYVIDDQGADLVERVQAFSQQDYFDQQKIAAFSQAIRQTGYYDSVIVRANVNRAASQQNTQYPSQHKVPVELLLTVKPKHNYQAGLGASTDTGPRLTFNWDRPWVNTSGHSMAASLYLSNPKRSVDLSYAIPMADPLNDFLKLQLGLKTVNQNQTDSTTYTLAAQRQFGAKEESDWDKTLSLKYEQETFVQGLADEQTTRLLLPGFGFNRLRKEGDIFVDWGDRQSLLVEAGSESLLSDVNIVRALVRTKWIRSAGQHRFIFRAEAGAIVSNNFEEVPSSLRFFAGGDQSVRGFGLNELGERVLDTDSDEESLIGGRFLAVASAEYAYPIADKWRAAVFFDAGSAADEFLQNAAYGTGIGAHWLSPIGTIRVYLARGHSDIENTWRLHFNIGPGI